MHRSLSLLSPSLSSLSVYLSLSWVHLSRGKKKGEHTYWQGEASSNRLAPVPRARCIHSVGLSFIIERNKTRGKGTGANEREEAGRRAGVAVLKKKMSLMLSLGASSQEERR